MWRGVRGVVGMTSALTAAPWRAVEDVQVGKPAVKLRPAHLHYPLFADAVLSEGEDGEAQSVSPAFAFLRFFLSAAMTSFRRS